MQTQTENLSALEVFESGLSKTDIKVMANAAIESVLNQGNILQVAEALAAMIEFVETVKKDPRFKDYVREEAGKNKGGYVAPSGAKIELAETGTAYNFELCGDVELEMLEQAFESAQNSLKERKEFLKKVPTSGIDVIVPYTGEAIKVFPPSKTSTSSYKITLSK